MLSKKLKLNKELKKSLVYNKLVLNITNEDYDKINLLLKNLKQEYRESLNYITKNYSKFEKIKFHNQLVNKIISEVLNSFDILNKYKVCAFLTGSFARTTNKINSDLDLLFCYENKYRKKLFIYEEIIFYILFSVFGTNRGKIHNVILSKINKNNNFFQNKLDSNDLTIILQSGSKKFEYKINGNLKRRIYQQYGNRKDLKIIFKYLKKEVKFMNREWAHVFCVFTNEAEFMRYYDKLYNYERKIINKGSIIRRMQRIKNYIDIINNKLENANKNSLCEFKKLFQMEEFTLLYEYIAYKRDLLLLNGGEMKYINLAECQKFLKEDDIYDVFMSYFFDLFDIVEPFKTNYSIHKDCYIDEYFFDLLEAKLFALNKKIGEIVWKD